MPNDRPEVEDTEGDPQSSLGDFHEPSEGDQRKPDRNPSRRPDESTVKTPAFEPLAGYSSDQPAERDPRPLAKGQPESGY